jgi:hypothetical protein
LKTMQVSNCLYAFLLYEHFLMLGYFSMVFLTFSLAGGRAQKWVLSYLNSGIGVSGIDNSFAPVSKL